MAREPVTMVGWKVQGDDIPVSVSEALAEERFGEVFELFSPGTASIGWKVFGCRDLAFESDGSFVVGVPVVDVLGDVPGTIANLAYAPAMAKEVYARVMRHPPELDPKVLTVMRQV